MDLDLERLEMRCNSAPVLGFVLTSPMYRSLTLFLGLTDHFKYLTEVSEVSIFFCGKNEPGQEWSILELSLSAVARLKTGQISRVRIILLVYIRGVHERSVPSSSDLHHSS